MTEAATWASEPTATAPGPTNEPPAPKSPRTRVKRSITSVLADEFRRSYSLVLFVLAWEALPRLGVVDDLFLPPFSATLGGLWTGLTESGLLWRDTLATVERAAAGLLIGCALGILIGALMSQFRLVDEFFERPLSLLFPIPKLALLPLFMLWLGLGNTSMIAIIVVTVFFPMCVNTYSGMKGVDKYLVWNARTKGASRMQVLRRVALPAAVPFMLAGFKISSALALLVTIAVEMFTSSDGLGYQVVLSQSTFKSEQMFAAIVLVAILGFIVDRVVGVISRRTLQWQEK